MTATTYEDVRAGCYDPVARLRRHTDLPISIGFGIRTPEQAASIARLADGVVVGSALGALVVGEAVARIDQMTQQNAALVEQVAGPTGGTPNNRFNTPFGQAPWISCSHPGASRPS